MCKIYLKKDQSQTKVYGGYLVVFLHNKKPPFKKKVVHHKQDECKSFGTYLSTTSY